MIKFNYNLEINEDEYEVIIDALSIKPFREVVQLINKLAVQVSMQRESIETKVAEINTPPKGAVLKETKGTKTRRKSKTT